MAAALLAAMLAAPDTLATPPAPTASATRAAPSPAVDGIIAGYVAARGGLEKLRSLRTLRQEGRVNAGAGRDGLVTREIKRGGRIRFEFTVQGVTGVFASDGKEGWKVYPFDGEMGPQPLPEDVVMEASEQADIDGPLVDWKSKGHQVELAGRETVDGREAYRLKVTLKSGGVLFSYLDVKSKYLVKTESTRQVRGRPVRMETTFSDYRKTKGILFPHLVEVRAAGRPQVLRVVVDKVEVNPPLSDARFARPAGS
jgi:outer membrane lipoprotein-sorting protein